MRIQVGGGVRLFFDVEGAKLIPDGPWMRERPTVVLLHPGPGFDHAPFRVGIGPWLAAGNQVVYLDMRGSGRSDGGTAEEHRLERWSEDLREFCDRVGIERPIVLGLGFGSMVALDYAARHPQHPSALVLLGPVARIVPELSIAKYEQLGGEEARDVARSFYSDMDERAFADFVRVCFPLLSTYPLTSDVIARADWNPEVLMRWMRGEAKEVDLRDALAAVEVPVLVLAGEDDAWAPLESVREVADLLPGRTRVRSFVRARHSVLRDAPEAYEDLRSFLDDLREAEVGP
jgi:pimeloyl-ACP methyl ester carboxylesterase